MTRSKANYVSAAIGILLIGTMVKVSNAYDVLTVENGGELSGTIGFKGPPPNNAPLKVDRDIEYCGKTVPDESLIIDPETKGIQNVVISLEGISQGKKHDTATITLDNSQCRFVPPTLAAMVGDYYELKNSDTILHNTHLRLEGGATILNVVLPGNKTVIKKTLTNEGMINGNCDAHHFMKVRIQVFDHPYFAVTDKNGKFVISDIPPGNYKVKFWHEMLSVKDKEITIAPHKKTDLPVELSLKK